VENLEERNLLVDPGVDGRMILMGIFLEVGCGCMDWIELAKKRDGRRAILNAVLNIRVP
jgi:hypothetical protein